MKRSKAGEAPTADELEDFRGYCENVSNAQLRGIYEKEKTAGRDHYALIAEMVARSRGVDVH